MKALHLIITLLIVSKFCLGQSKFENDTLSRDKYYNPIENRTYRTEGSFKRYRNGVEVDTIQRSLKKETKLERVILLSSNEELNESISIEEFKTIKDKIDKIFIDLFGESKQSGKIMIQFELKKDIDNVIRFSIRDNLDLNIMRKFEKRVLSERFPKSNKYTIKFQFIYKVNSIDDKN
ncbi:hypothetical protein [uncultured Acetobacteroides sp.]|uniref:hypothetical protein n=1 Tax=uncultured Acetobacteroides sp. TaxID=1760811 RepID=UPI0029F4A00E|nr:hypothetical protein [uncultured Acetobacteroides sp.]